MRITEIKNDRLSIGEDLLDKENDSMNSSSYFEYEDNLNDKYDYHACKMSLELTLDENDVMDCV